MKLDRLAASGLTLLLTSQAGVAAAVQSIVPGNSNPNLAGRESGYTCCGGDSMPEQAPTLVAGLTFGPSDVLTFVVSGRVALGGEPPPGDNPDGDGGFSMTNYGDGISAPEQVRTNALLGVFLGDETPTGAPTPEPLSFASGLGFTSIAPGIGQIFFIGDGLTSDTNAGFFDGEAQAFIAPVGATRLFLGTCDGFGWYNNGGSFTVDVVATPRGCGDPTGALGITASDALFILSVAVGVETGALCVCDADGSGGVTASDALAVLLHAVGLGPSLQCPACAG
jgi:hypothetical protein